MKKSELIEIATKNEIKVAGSWTKEKIKDSILSELCARSAQVHRDIEHHDRHRNCYFWRPPGSASQRRAAEKKGSYSTKMTVDGHTYKYVCGVTCSCKNYYYSAGFVVDGQTKTVRAWRKLYEIIGDLCKSIENA